MQCSAHPFRPTADLEHFYVILVISNPQRYERRYELFWKTYQMCKDAGVNIIVVESQLGLRPFMVTQSGNPNHVQMRTIEELWLKENMINIGIRRAMQIDPLAREAMWLDADCFPMCSPREWFEEVWHALQHYEFVQCWEYLINFGPKHQPVTGPQMSFMATYAAAGFKVPEAPGIKHTLSGHSGNIPIGRPGLAWAANISAINQVGGIIDFCILGSGDFWLARALVGDLYADHAFEAKKLHKYAEALLLWQEKAERWIKRDVGHVKLTVGHWWHGDKADRQYPTRGKILVSNGYDPQKDIKYDAHGCLQLETWEPRQIRLRDQIRGYFATRNEDNNQISK